MTAFQAIAPSSAAPATGTTSPCGTSTIPAIVPATAPPTRSGPSRLNTAASSAAWKGVAARVATSVAIAFAVSWMPFVRANTSPSATASASSGPTG